MTPKLFITGGTGYIGGSVLHTIATAHPEYDITVLLRNIPATFKTTYPNIKIIQGDYDSFDTIATAAEAAEIVIHNGNSDHEPSLNAILAGLLKRPTPGHLLHLSGSGIVSDWASENTIGRLNPKTWSDISSLDEIKNLPAEDLHRNTEIILHDAIREHGDRINVAIMCPPDIYGKGLGPGKTRSAFVPLYVGKVREIGKVFYYGEGSSTRSWVHIDDLMKLYLRVVEAAASGGRSAEYFNEGGYYFAGTQEHTHLDVARVTGRVLHQRGVVADPEPVRISLEELDSMLQIPGYEHLKLARYLFASNARTRPERAEKLFGYKGSAPGLLESLERDIVDAVET